MVVRKTYGLQEEGEQCGGRYGDCAGGLVCVPPATGSPPGARSICYQLCGSFGPGGSDVTDSCAYGQTCSGRAALPCQAWAGECFLYCTPAMGTTTTTTTTTMSIHSQGEGDQCGTSGSTGYFYGDCAGGLECVPPAAGSPLGARSICHKQCGYFYPGSGAGGSDVTDSCAYGQTCSGRAALPCQAWAGECFLYCAYSTTTATTTTITSSTDPGYCTLLSGRYCQGQVQDCDCNYCDDFCADDGCARTCRVLNGYFSSPAGSKCKWSAVSVTNPSPDANGLSCDWMEGNGDGEGNGDNCRNCDQYAVACRRANPSGNCWAGTPTPAPTAGPGCGKPYCCWWGSCASCGTAWNNRMYLPGSACLTPAGDRYNEQSDAQDSCQPGKWCTA